MTTQDTGTSVEQSADTPAPDASFEQIPASELEAHLASVEGDCDEWLDDNAEKFDPLKWDEVEERRLRRKSFGELAIYLYVADARDRGEVAPAIRELVEKRVNDSRYLDVVQRNPREFLKYAYPMGYANWAGLLSEEAVEAVDATIARRPVWATERVPYRMLDLWHFCQLYGYDECPYEASSIVERSCLNFPPSVVDSTLSDAYALTHDVLFYCGFGAGTEEFPSHPVPYDLSEVLPGLILRYMAEDNADIVLELVLVGVLQRQIPPGLVRSVLGWLDRKRESVEFVPGPDTGQLLELERTPRSGERVDEEELPDSLDEEWAYNYHTTLVAASTATILREEWSEFRREAPDGPDTDHGGQLLELGLLLRSLADYDLQEAAERMQRLAGSDVAEAYPSAFRSAVDYLRSQQTDDGFGYWTDEQSLYLSLGHDPEVFVEDLLEPAWEACAEALSTAEANGW